METEKIQQLKQYLLTLKMPDQISDKMQKYIKKEAKNYTIFQNVLFRYNTTNGVIRKVLNKNEAQEIIEAYHQHPLGGERRQTVNIFIVPRQLENELLRNNLFENGVSTLSLENQKQHKIIKTKKHINTLISYPYFYFTSLHFTLLYFTTEYYILFIFSLFYKPIKPSSVQIETLWSVFYSKY